jgi:antitoxin component YwqK of YwqJK toxin-antitoxin module
MLKQFLLTALMLNTIALFAQKGTKRIKSYDRRTGIAESYRVAKYDLTTKFGEYTYSYQGQTQVVGNYISNLKEGRWTYTPNPDFKIVGNYKNNKKDGVWKYYQKSTLIAEKQFLNGKSAGKQISYYRNGKIYSESYYENGKSHGRQQLYWANGRLKRETEMVNGKMNGEHLSFEEDGALLYSIEYYDNQPITLTSQKSSDSLNFYLGDLTNGTGNLVLFSTKDGEAKKIIEVHFKDSVLHGSLYFLSPIEAVTSYTGEFENGLMVGEWKFFNNLRDFEKRKTYSLSDSLAYDSEMGFNENFYQNFVAIESMPQFGPRKTDVDLLKYVAHSVNYPTRCKQNGITGVSYVSYVVGLYGQIYDVEIQKESHPLLDAESVRVIKNLPYYQPGLQSNLPVSVQFTIPIRYVLN